MERSNATERIHGMTNQANAQKVMRAIIDPYKRVYGDMHPDLVEDLS